MKLISMNTKCAIHLLFAIFLVLMVSTFGCGPKTISSASTPVMPSTTSIATPPLSTTAAITTATTAGSTNKTTAANPTLTVPLTSNPPVTMTINTAGAFDPQLYIINTATTVKFFNVSPSSLTLVSDYPFQTTIPGGGVFEFTFINAGSWSVWDQAFPNDTAGIYIKA